MYGDMQEPVRLKFDRVPLRDLVGAVFRGSRYAYVLDSANLFVAETGCAMRFRRRAFIR